MKFRFIPFTLFSVTLMTTFLWATPSITKQQKLRVCVETNNYPFSFIQNNQVKGMSIDLLKKFFQLPQFKQTNITYVPVASSQESLRFFKEDSCDVLPTQLLLENSHLKRTQTNAWLTIPNVFITNKENFHMFYKESDHVTIVPNETFQTYAKKHFKILQSTPSIEQAFDRVQKQNVDFALVPLPLALYHLQTYENLTIANVLDIQSNLHIEFSEAFKTFVPLFNTFISSLSQNELTTLKNRWLTFDNGSTTNYSIIWQLTALFGAIILFLLYREYTLGNYNEHLEELSNTDALTNVHNRLKIDKLLNSEFERAFRYDRPFAVIMIDVDEFKKVNDTYGHQIGDVVLKEIADLLKQNVRDTDMLGRWGGEEFMIICPETDLEGAIFLSEQLRMKAMQNEFIRIGSQTLSFGVSQYEESDTMDELLQRADMALYQAKVSGKNRVFSLQR
jgi:polar amino acid transport system substrate-binding protein